LERAGIPATDGAQSFCSESYLGEIVLPLLMMLVRRVFCDGHCSVDGHGDGDDEDDFFVMVMVAVMVMVFKM
jgi:hypothetical protein